MISSCPIPYFDCFYFNAQSTPEIYTYRHTLSLHDALPILFLDITASVDDRPTLFQTVEAVARQIYIPLTVGGGVRNCADVRALLSAGADKVSINTAAVDKPDFVSEAGARYGVQCIVVAIDAKRVNKKKEPVRWEDRKSTRL